MHHPRVFAHAYEGFLRETLLSSALVARVRARIRDLLGRGIYAKPAVFPYAPSYCCLRSTWPGLVPVLACVVTPGYSNTHSHHHLIPHAEAGKRILSFWLLCSCCSLEEVKGGLAKHCPNLDVLQLSWIGFCQDCKNNSSVFLCRSYTPTKETQLQLNEAKVINI